MKRMQLSLLSEALAVSMTAMIAPETKSIPWDAARTLSRLMKGDAMEDACERFVAQLEMAHGDLNLVASAGRVMRDAVAYAMTYTPPDAGRVDIHG